MGEAPACSIRPAVAGRPPFERWILSRSVHGPLVPASAGTGIPHRIRGSGADTSRKVPPIASIGFFMELAMPKPPMPSS